MHSVYCSKRLWQPVIIWAHHHRDLLDFQKRIDFPVNKTLILVLYTIAEQSLGRLLIKSISSVLVTQYELNDVIKFELCSKLEVQRIVFKYNSFYIKLRKSVYMKTDQTQYFMQQDKINGVLVHNNLTNKSIHCSYVVSSNIFALWSERKLPCNHILTH